MRTFISTSARVISKAQTILNTLEKVTRPLSHDDGAEALSKIEEEEEVWEPTSHDQAVMIDIDFPSFKQSFADAAATSVDNPVISAMSDKRQSTNFVGPQPAGEEASPTPQAASSPRPGFGHRSADKILVANVLAWLNEQDNELDLATWLEPAVLTILDDHIPRPAGISSGIACYNDSTTCHHIYDDWQAWQEHVAKLLCEHIVQALPDYVK